NKAVVYQWESGKRKPSPGLQLSHGDASALAGMERRLGDNSVRYRSVTSRPTRPSVVVTSLFKVLRPDGANNLTTPGCARGSGLSGSTSGRARRVSRPRTITRIVPVRAGPRLQTAFGRIMRAMVKPM